MLGLLGTEALAEGVAPLRPKGKVELGLRGLRHLDIMRHAYESFIHIHVLVHK